MSSKLLLIKQRTNWCSSLFQLGMSSHENATPIPVLHNSAAHLSGPSRSLGGVVIGYLGVRVFCPRPVAAMLDTVGGCSVLLGKFAVCMCLQDDGVQRP